MSVTLKLADEDAAVVGSILRAYAQTQTEETPDEKFKAFYWRMKASSGHRTMEHINELAGAFQIAVRANQR